MADRPNPPSAVCWSIVLACCLFALTLSVTACRAPGQASGRAAVPSPVPYASSTPFPTASGSIAVGLESGEIWLLVGDQAPRLLTHGHDPQLSPNGCAVSFVRQPTSPPPIPQHWLLYLRDPTASWQLWPLDERSGLVYGLAWSPNSQGLAMTNGASIKRIYGGNLRWIDASTGAVTEMAESGAGMPDFSPDGNWIATWTPDIGWSHGSVGLWHVADGTGKTLFSPLFRQALQWADDSSGFAVALQRHGETGMELWWVPVDAAPVELGRLPGADYVLWQPGAERLAYYAPRFIEDPESQTARSAHTLHLADRDGSGDVIVPDSEGMSLFSWSPDGRWLLTTDPDGHTYIVDTDALHAPLLLTVDHVHRWLDATHYLASTFHSSSTELYRCVPPEGCQLLARLSGRVRAVTYAGQICPGVQ